MATIRQGARFIGRVQGVGFRVFVQETAREMGFTGWVKNMADGSVLMEAQGDEAHFGALKERIQKGNGLCRVDHMTFQICQKVEGEEGFEIRK